MRARSTTRVLPLVERLGQAAVVIHGEGEGRHVLARGKLSLRTSSTAISHIIDALEVSKPAEKTRRRRAPGG
jgi:hypothetical protein